MTDYKEKLRAIKPELVAEVENQLNQIKADYLAHKSGLLAELDYTYWQSLYETAMIERLAGLDK